MAEEILADDPDDPHALFAKAMYGFENVLPGITRDDIPAVIDHMLNVAASGRSEIRPATRKCQTGNFLCQIHPTYPFDPCP